MYLPALKTIELCKDKGALSVFLAVAELPRRDLALTDRPSLARAWAVPPALAWCRIRRGFAAARTQVRDCEQAWSMDQLLAHHARRARGGVHPLRVPARTRFQRPGHLCSKGALVLIKMCERLSYLNADHHPSGWRPPPRSRKTVWEPAAIEDLPSRPAGY